MKFLHGVSKFGAGDGFLVPLTVEVLTGRASRFVAQLLIVNLV